jgi:hypothetical protein
MPTTTTWLLLALSSANGNTLELLRQLSVVVLGTQSYPGDYILELCVAGLCVLNNEGALGTNCGNNQNHGRSVLGRVGAGRIALLLLTPHGSVRPPWM